MTAVRCDAQAESGAELGRAIDALLALEGDLPYANFAPLRVSPPALAHLHAARWRACDQTVATVVSRDAAKRPLVALRLERRPFESQHFSRPIAVVPPPVGIAETAIRQSALDAALPVLIETARKQRIAHLVVRVSARDIAGTRAIQAVGGRYTGTQVSWMLDLDGRPHRGLSEGFHFEFHSPESMARITPSATRRIVDWAGHAFDHSPFAFDAALPGDLAVGLYGEWIKKVFAGEWCDGVMLVRYAGEVVSLISIQVLADLSAAAEAVVIGRCLAVTLPGHQGLASACVREMVTLRPLDAAYLEGETPVTTLGTVNLFARLGFRYLRATSQFHLALG